MSPEDLIRFTWVLIIDRTMSNNVQFLLLNTSFHCGIAGGVSCETIPQPRRWSRDSRLKYSPSQSDRISMLLSSWFCTSFLNSLNFSNVFHKIHISISTEIISKCNEVLKSSSNLYVQWSVHQYVLNLINH